MNELFKSILLLYVWMSGCFCTIHAQAPLDLCQQKNTAFKSGEKLNYVLYYNWNFFWVPAGSLEFIVHESDDSYLIDVTGKTYDSYEWFFKVEDYYHSEIDKATMRPVLYHRDISEGNYKLKNDILFDYENQKILSTVLQNDKKTKKYGFGLQSCVHDLLSLIYKLRNIDMETFKKQEVIQVELIFDEKIYHIPIRYIGQSKNKSIRNLGKTDLVVISPDLISGNVFSGNSNMQLWITDDSNKIPLMIESPIKVGSIKAVLQSYENLREPLKFE